jgi:peptidylprolyl isomerase
MILATSLVGCEGLFNKGFKKTRSGIHYKIFTKKNDDTTRVTAGKIVSLDFRYGLEDSIIFDSRNMPDGVRFPVSTPQYEGDFFDALTLFNQGDSGVFHIKAGPFFEKTVGQPEPPPFIQEDEDLYFWVHIKKIQTNAEIALEEQLKLQSLKAREDSLLAVFISRKPVTVQPSASGVYYMETLKGKGKVPEKDDFVQVHFTVSLLTGEKIFSTRDMGKTEEFQFGSKYENAGFQEAVGMMSKGGKAEALVPSGMAFGPTGAGDLIQPYTSLHYELEIVDIQTPAQHEANKKAEAQKMQSEESRLLGKYLAESGISTKPQASGLIYIERQKGTGPRAISGNKVQVHYIGKLLDGSIFDSSYDRGQPFEFTLGRKAVIDGWDEGIALMNESGKATLVIPSKLAYKDRGAGDRIPPYATLIFEVELVKILE